MHNPLLVVHSLGNSTLHTFHKKICLHICKSCIVTPLLVVHSPGNSTLYTSHKKNHSQLVDIQKYRVRICHKGTVLAPWLFALAGHAGSANGTFLGNSPCTSMVYLASYNRWLGTSVNTKLKGENTSQVPLNIELKGNSG